MNHDETLEIGYMEDAVFWLTASATVRDAAAAERHLGRGWRVDAEVFLAPTGEWADEENQEWAESGADAPGARRGWRLVNTAQEFVEDEWGERKRNPHYDPSSERDRRSL